jgi:hypothetical protein
MKYIKDPRMVVVLLTPNDSTQGTGKLPVAFGSKATTAVPQDHQSHITRW